MIGSEQSVEDEHSCAVSELRIFPSPRALSRPGGVNPPALSLTLFLPLYRQPSDRWPTKPIFNWVLMAQFVSRVP